MSKRTLPPPRKNEVDDFEDALKDPALQRLVKFQRARRPIILPLLSRLLMFLLWTVAIGAAAAFGWIILNGLTRDDLLQFIERIPMLAPRQ